MSANQSSPNAPTMEWGQAVSTIPHRLQSPVSAIQIYARLIRKEAPAENEDLATSLAGIEASAHELNRVIHTLSQARAVGLDALDVYKEPTNVGELVEECASEVGARLNERRIDVTVADDVSSSLDRILLCEILEELIDNAARFSLRDEPIELVVQVSSDHVEVLVIDRGSGIPSDNTEDVFEPFVKLDPNRSGLGLGLYVARGAARAQGGDLTVNGSAEGGCRFTLSLPQTG